MQAAEARNIGRLLEPALADAPGRRIEQQDPYIDSFVAH
jgi:hypothetical protein